MTPKRSTPVLLKFVPHGLNDNNFYPITNEVGNIEEFTKFKKKLCNDEEYDFILLFNSRNIRRKSIPDTILAWRLFVDTLSKEQAKKCLLVLHTNPIDENGTDIPAVLEYLCPPDYCKVTISDNRFSPEVMNYLYNCADGVILLSSNEGWGLSLTESLLTGTPIIANVTGGMQDQMRFVDKNEEWYTPSKEVPSNHKATYKKCGEWALPVFPSNSSLVGSIPTPYIFDDRCRPEDAAVRIGELYNMKDQERKRIGLLGREWALGDEAGFTSKKMAKRVMEGIDALFENWKPREKFQLIQDTEYKQRTLNHSLTY